MDNVLSKSESISVSNWKVIRGDKSKGECWEKVFRFGRIILRQLKESIPYNSEITFPMRGQI